MNLEAQSILTDLRTISSIQKNEWLQTKYDNNGKLYISDKYVNTYSNMIHYALKMECWEYSKICLKALYCEDIPNLVERLMAECEDKDLRNLDKLLVNSLKGLDILMKTYSIGAITNHLIGIKLDYGQTIHEKINDYLNNPN